MRKQGSKMVVERVTKIVNNITKSEMEENREALVNLWKRNNGVPLKKVKEKKLKTYKVVIVKKKVKRKK
jgi:hypothetical protein